MIYFMYFGDTPRTSFCILFTFTVICFQVEVSDNRRLVDVHIFITQFQQKFDLRTTMLVCFALFVTFDCISVCRPNGRRHREQETLAVYNKRPSNQYQLNRSNLCDVLILFMLIRYKLQSQ